MYLEISLLCEGLPAEVTFEGFDTEVFSDVDLKAGLLRVGDRAEVTLVGLDQPVVEHVGLQVALCDERLIAARVAAEIRSFIGLLKREVRCQRVRKILHLWDRWSFLELFNF
jgi:hypothetical protein